MSKNARPEHAGCCCAGGPLRRVIQPRLLLALAQRKSHGYELMEILGQEGYTPDPGSLYRTLRSFEENGLVCSSWDTSNAGPARRVYELTELGVEYLHTWVIDIRKTRQWLDGFLAQYEAHFYQPPNPLSQSNE
ncbi:MAG: helix-turn-helix transcriptional regulator [Anaerolineales bacterium]|nr:helix-turn-helix transcriptional regulator [Anaerolineales bacterium]